MKNSLFNRLVTGIATGALVLVGAVISGSAASAAPMAPAVVAPMDASSNPLSCRNNVPETDFTADHQDPDLTGSLHTDLYMLINKARVSAGQEPYEVSNLLSGEAGAWARTGPAGGNLKHASDSERKERLPSGFTNEGENIFSGYTVDKAPYIFNMWMNSELHRANILCPTFTHIGSGNNTPHGGNKFHVVQRFAAYPTEINPDDSATWLPYSIPNPNAVFNEPVAAGTFIEDDPLEENSLNTYQKSALARINELRAAESLEPVIPANLITRSVDTHLSSFADQNGYTQTMNNFKITNDENLFTTALTHSGDGAAEMLVAQATKKEGRDDIDLFFNKGALWKTIILNPEWTHVGMGQATATYYGSPIATYSGLRFASYPPVPVPVEQDNKWNTQDINLLVGKTPSAQTAVIEADGNIFLQAKEGSKWVTQNTFVAKNGTARVTFPAITKSGTHSYRLLSPGDDLYFLEWTSPVLTVTATKSAQANTWTGANVNNNAGQRPGNLSATIESNGTVALQEQSGSTWKTVKTITVKNGKADIEFPIQSAVGIKAYRLYSAGNDAFLPWTSKAMTVTTAKVNADNSFNTSAISVNVGTRPAKRDITVQGSSEVELQEKRGSTWVTFGTFPVKEGKASLEFPVQSTAGTKYYRAYSPASATHNAWTSGSVTVTATKANPSNSFSTSALSVDVGSRPDSRGITVQSALSVYLQEQRGSDWVTVGTATVTNGKATVQFPVQSSSGTKYYRAYTAATTTHNSWSSSSIKVTANTVVQKSSISGVKKYTYVVPVKGKKTFAVNVSSQAVVQMKHGSHPWKTQTTLKAGKNTVSLSASTKYGKKLYYRVYIPATSKVTSAVSPTITLQASAQKSYVSGIKKTTYTVPTKGKKYLTVNVSSPALVQMKYGSKPWKTVSKVKTGKHKISLAASTKYGKKLYYRVYIPKTAAASGKWSSTVTIYGKKKTSITGMKGGNNKVKRSKYYKDKIKLNSAGYFQKYSGGKWKTIKKLPAGTSVLKVKASSKKGGRVLYRVLISNSSKKIGTSKRVRIIAY